MAFAESQSPTFSPFGQDSVCDESGLCPACGHSEVAHETLLTSTVSWVVCHESTEEGECFRVRHSEGIPFGACRRDPA